MQLRSLRGTGAICANWMAERIGQKGVEIEKYLETVRVFLRQIINITIIVMYHDWGKFDSCILEGKYKDLVQY